jgi:hypothetical protein
MYSVFALIDFILQKYIINEFTLHKIRVSGAFILQYILHPMLYTCFGNIINISLVVVQENLSVSHSLPKVKLNICGVPLKKKMDTKALVSKLSTVL